MRKEQFCVPQTAYRYFNVGGWWQSCATDLQQTQRCFYFDSEEQQTTPSSHKHRKNGPSVVTRKNTISSKCGTIACHLVTNKTRVARRTGVSGLTHWYECDGTHLTFYIVSQVARMQSLFTMAGAKSTTDWSATLARFFRLQPAKSLSDSVNRGKISTHTSTTHVHTYFHVVHIKRNTSSTKAHKAEFPSCRSVCKILWPMSKNDTEL